jgi:hypothetical protein
VLFLWSEPVTGLDPSSVVLHGAASFAAQFDAGSRGSSFTGTVTPLGTGRLCSLLIHLAFSTHCSFTFSLLIAHALLAGVLTITLPAGAAADYAGNPSTEAAVYEVRHRG